MTEFAGTSRGAVAQSPPRATPLTLARVRLGAGGPLVSVRVADGSVTHVVPEREAPAPAGLVPGDRVLDLDGRILLPGLWDAHVHLAEWAAARRRLDLSGTASAREVADRVREHGRAAPAGPVLFGYGFRDGLWSDAPHKELLD
ncbi:amidohydrolase family protein, partial [Streptomyces sp. NPDC048279]|uniref:amidohydrolase family protein n=1 Tax=Streptomyces sp. NPDC048279 TaxID=3154714 RepID=UPI00342C7B4F